LLSQEHAEERNRINRIYLAIYGFLGHNSPPLGRVGGGVLMHAACTEVRRIRAVLNHPCKSITLEGGGQHRIRLKCGVETTMVVDHAVSALESNAVPRVEVQRSENEGLEVRDRTLFGAAGHSTYPANGTLLTTLVGQ
jgi:hypothetical protein